MKAFTKGLMTLALGACLITMAAPDAKADNWRSNRNDHQQQQRYDRHDNDNRGRGNDYRFNGDNNGRWNNQRVVYVPARPIVINRTDRVVIHDYVTRDRWQSPYARRYLVGATLPRDVIYYPVPYRVRERLAPIPVGYQYVRVDNDVLLIDTIGRILDAVTMI